MSGTVWPIAKPKSGSRTRPSPITQARRSAAIASMTACRAPGPVTPPGPSVISTSWSYMSKNLSWSTPNSARKLACSW